MKTVKNSNFAGRDLNVSGTNYTGDADGIFAMADEHADKILTMRGWAESAVAPVAPEDFDPVKALRETVDETAVAPPAPGLSPAPTVPAPPAEPDPAPESPQDAPEPQDEQPPVEDDDGAEPAGGEPEGEAEDDGPDLEAMTTKTALFACAKEWDVTLTSVQKKLDVPELRVVLEKAIYGEEGG